MPLLDIPARVPEVPETDLLMEIIESFFSLQQLK